MLSEAEHSTASEGSDDADDFQQTTKRRSKKSAYDVDITDSEQESDSDSPDAKRKGSRRSLRGSNAKSDPAPPARRQPRRTAAAKVSLAESPSDSSESSSEQSAEEAASDDDQEDSGSKKRIGRDRKADKPGAKRQKALITEDDSDASMAEAGEEDVQVISDSEAQPDEESDKENQPAKRTRFASCSEQLCTVDTRGTQYA